MNEFMPHSNGCKSQSSIAHIIPKGCYITHENVWCSSFFLIVDKLSLWRYDKTIVITI